MQVHIGSTKRDRKYVEQKRSSRAIEDTQNLKDVRKFKSRIAEIGQEKFEYIIENFDELNREREEREFQLKQTEQRSIQELYNSLTDECLNEEHVNEAFFREQRFSDKVKFLEGVDPQDIFEERNPEDIAYEEENLQRRDFYKIKDKYLKNFKKRKELYAPAQALSDAYLETGIILTYLHGLDNTGEKKSIYLLNMHRSKIKELLLGMYNGEIKEYKYQIEREEREIFRLIDAYKTSSRTVKDAIKRCGYYSRLEEERAYV